MEVNELFEIFYKYLIACNLFRRDIIVSRLENSIKISYYLGPCYVIEKVKNKLKCTRGTTTLWNICSIDDAQKFLDMFFPNYFSMPIAWAIKLKFI